MTNHHYHHNPDSEKKKKVTPNIISEEQIQYKLLKVTTELDQ